MYKPKPNDMGHTIKIERTLTFTDENIGDLLVAAFEGGIDYWCRMVRIMFVPEEHLGKYEYASDVIALGGVLELYDAESPDTWELTLDKFLNGLKMYCEENNYKNAEDLMDGHDADTADAIVQYALFDDVIFG